jgi:hypothetical protein
MPHGRSARKTTAAAFCAPPAGNFSQREIVGSITLHIERRASALIRAYELAPSLITAERPEVLITLVAAAQAVATKLHDELNIGDGCLDWHVPHTRTNAARQLVPGFAPVRGRRRRGHTRLRRCP